MTSENGLPETQLAGPSPTDPTRTSAPISPTPLPARPSLVPQLRDSARYDILGEHGRGGLGRVARAHDRELGRDIAIKELISRGHVSELRFFREALITARLEHPGIVPVYEAGRWADGTPFYAMKLVAGRPLRDLILERKTVDERIGLLHHVIAVADAIAYAHGRNIIHRDLKPANVIVGDFGETVVIDWGLAKDLSADEESTIGGGPFRGNRDDGLTSTGSILGTPAYMAPEQERGESVDQRADVYAIGVMLWELCSLQKLPPRYAGQRRRLLRKAGIDPDLAAIIDKACDPDPARRYHDAGVLAPDLKAFNAGARIAARRYSLFAMFAHWTRRHRALSLAAASIVAIGVAGSCLFVQSIASERDRADKSEEISRRSQAAAEASLAELTLKHAELLLTTDPSSAVDALAAYHGNQRDRAAQIRAEAVGRGVALLRAKPHTDRIQWATGSHGGSIISLGIDGTITRTLPDQRSTVLATGVSLKGRFAFAPARGLLAYGCDPADVCIWDINRDKAVARSPELRDWQLAAMAFSPDESKLALLSYSGRIRVLDVSSPERPVARLELLRDKGVGVTFANDDSIVIGLSAPLGIELIRLNGDTQSFTTHEHFLWEAMPSDHRLVLATRDGEGLYLALEPLRVLNRVALCHGNPTGLKRIGHRRAVAFSCEEGPVGTWNLEDRSPTLLTRMEGHTDRIAVDQSGDYLLVAGGNGMLAVVDLSTMLIATYRGHGFAITSISPPTATFPYIVTADVRGSVRVWPLPNHVARVSANVHTRFASASFDTRSSTIFATTFLPEIAIFSVSNESHFVGPHLVSATNLEVANDGHAFAAYGSSQSIEIWKTETRARYDVVATGHGAVSRVAFVTGSDDLVTGGRDGRLIYWNSVGDPKQVISLNSPIIDFALAQDGRFAIVITSDGSIWRTDDEGTSIRLRTAGSHVVRMRSTPLAETIFFGYANGDVTILDTVSWRELLVLHASQSIRDIAITPDGRTVAVADNDDIVHFGQLHGVTWNAKQVRWTTFSLRARAIALTSDGLLVSICTDGSIWIYSSSDKNWLYLPVGTSELTIVATSPDGKTAATFDTDGRMILLNLESARKSIADRQLSTAIFK